MSPCVGSKEIGRGSFEFNFNVLVIISMQQTLERRNQHSGIQGLDNPSIGQQV